MSFQQSRRWALVRSVSFAAAVLVVLATPRAEADFGPKLGSALDAASHIELFLDGRELRDTPLNLAVFETHPTSGSISTEALPGFAGTTGVRLEHARWLQTIRSVPDGHVRLNGFKGRQGAIQLVIRLRDEPIVYVSNAVELHPLCGRFRCELTSDAGSSGFRQATLSLDTTGRAWVDWLLAIWQRGFGLALATTLCVEGVIAVAWAIWRKAPGPRLLVRCLLGNLLTLPVVWVTTWAAFALTFSIPVGLSVLGLGEVGALACEACIYGWAGGRARGEPSGGGQSIRDSCLLATLANVSSFAAGVIWSHADSLGLS